MSSLPLDITVEATAIVSCVTSERTLQTSVSEDSPNRVKIYKLGSQLVQVARNSLLDINALRYEGM